MIHSFTILAGARARPPHDGRPTSCQASPTEVDEALDRADQLGLEVGVGADAVAQLRPEALGRHTERVAQIPSFHGCPLGTSGHRSSPSTRGRMPAHTSTNGCPVTSTAGCRTASARRDLLRAGDQVVEQHAEPPFGAGANSGDRGDEVVGAVHRLDDDAELAQVVAPDVLDELGVVLALDPDPARRGDLRGAVAGDRARGGDPRGRRRRWAAGFTSVTGRPSSRKPPGFHEK